MTLPPAPLRALDSDGMIERAFQLAVRGHAGQLRAQGGPYIAHPIAVAGMLVDVFGVTDPEVLCAALLHDAREDTNISELAIAAISPRTLAMVRLLTDPRPHMSSDERREHYKGIWADSDATLIKMADRLSNLHDVLRHPDPEFARRYAARTENEMLSAPECANHEPGGRLLREAARRARPLGPRGALGS